MSDYSRLYNFTAKDALSSGDPNKLIRGSEVDAELDAAATAIATKANDSAVVHNTGNETIAGNKTLSGTTTLSGAITQSGALTSTGGITMSGKSIEFAEGASVASAATCNIWGTDGNTVHVTGTTTITSFGTAPQAGAVRLVIFDGSLTLTHSANLRLPGADNISTSEGDSCIVYADTTTQLDVFAYTPSSIVPTQVSGLVKLTSGSVSNVATADIVLTGYTAFPHKLLVLRRIKPATDSVNVWLRTSTNGGSSYATTNAYRTSHNGAASGVGDQIGLNAGGFNLGNAANEASHLYIWMMETTSTDLYPMFNWTGIMLDPSSEPWSVNGAAARLNAEDTDAVRIMMSSGNVSGFDYVLFGVRA